MTVRELIDRLEALEPCNAIYMSNNEAQYFAVGDIERWNEADKASHYIIYPGIMVSG